MNNDYNINNKEPDGINFVLQLNTGQSARGPGQKINTSYLTWQRLPEDYCMHVPASSASSESAFSAAGITISQRRTSLDPDTVDNILFIHSNVGLD